MNLIKKFYTWILPYHCILCSYPSNRAQDLCESCYQNLPRIPNACKRCAKVITISGALCGHCLTQNPPFDITHAAYLYDTPLPQLILDLKFGKTLINARILGELLTEKIRSEWYQKNPLPQALIPVPLHQSRLKERGFNQALEISRRVAKSLNLPLLSMACTRTKQTLPQATLTKEQRNLNIKNAFSVTKPIPYQHIAVLDDVITTGDTITAFCKTLKKAGIQQIDVWCCARPAMDA